MGIFDELRKQRETEKPAQAAQAAPPSLAKPAAQEPAAPAAPTGGLKAPPSVKRRRVGQISSQVPETAPEVGQISNKKADELETTVLSSEGTEAADATALLQRLKRPTPLLSPGANTIVQKIDQMPAAEGAYTLRELQEDWTALDAEDDLAAVDKQERADLIKKATRTLQARYCSEMSALATPLTEREQVTLSALVKFTFDRLQKNSDVVTMLAPEDFAPIISSLRRVAAMRQASAKTKGPKAAKDTSNAVEDMVAAGSEMAKLLGGGDFDLGEITLDLDIEI